MSKLPSKSQTHRIILQSKSRKEAAQRLHISYAYLSVVCERYGWRFDHFSYNADDGRRKYSVEKAREIIKTCSSRKEASQMLDMDYSYLYKFCKRHNISLQHFKDMRGRPRGFAEPQRFLEMRKMHEEGATLREIASHYGVTFQRVHQILLKGGYDPCRRNDVDVCEAVRLAEDGLNAREIAQKMDTTAPKIMGILKNEWIGHQYNPAKKYRGNLPVAQMAKDYAEGMSLKQVAEKYNHFWTTVRRAFLLSNIPMRSRNEGAKLYRAQIREGERQ